MNNYDIEYLINLLYEYYYLKNANNKCIDIFDIDIKFIKQCYNLHNYTNEDIVNHVRNNNYINYIFHPKQLYNLFNDKIKLLVNENNYIQVEYENEYYDLNNFVNYIETFSYDTLKNICIKEIVNNTNIEIFHARSNLVVIINHTYINNVIIIKLIV